MSTVTGASIPTPSFASVSGSSGTLGAQIAAAITSSGALAVTNYDGSTTPTSPTYPTVGGVNFTTGGALQLPFGFSVIVDNATSLVSATGTGASGQMILAGTGGFNFVTGTDPGVTAGSGTIVAAGGSNAITVSSASTSVGGYLMALGDGNNTIATQTASNTIIGGAGTNLIDLTNTNSIGAFDSISLSGTDTVTATGGTGFDTIALSGSAKSFALSLSSGWTGKLAITANSVGGGSIAASAGNTTLIGAGHLATGYDKTALYTGSTGGAVAGTQFTGSTLSGATTNVYAGTGVDTIFATTNTKYIDGHAGVGHDLYVFSKSMITSGSSIEVQDFTVGADSISLVGYGNILTQMTASASVTQGHGVGANAKIAVALGDGTVVTFDHVDNLFADSSPIKFS